MKLWGFVLASGLVEGVIVNSWCLGRWRREPWLDSRGGIPERSRQPHVVNVNAAG